jgi:hypothetical protein
MGFVWGKRIFVLLLLAFSVAFVVTAPVQAAEVVRDAGRVAGDWASSALRALMTFLGSLVP